MLLEGIETLIVLSQAKTMSRAGSLLYISQSAVSKRIANLEKKLGKKLIFPQGRNVQLTQEAISLIENIGPTFNELRGLIYEQKSLPENHQLKLDCSETLVSGYLSTTIGQYFSHDPYLSITTNHTPRIVEHVQSGDAQLGICAGELPPNHHLSLVPLLKEPCYLVSATRLTALPSKIITNDLNNSSNTYQSSLLNDLHMRPVMEMDSYSAASHLALAGIAPALIPLSVIKTLKIEPQNCYHFEQLVPLYRPIHICLRPSAYKSQRITQLIDLLLISIPRSVKYAMSII
ncbi:LysR family transcriptional regulator [Vibrio ostreicida]|uniref:LysR family transcriptional regulator n=1 Tax=Vibrio ostreicida TaxID=526588 RepID=A0ABT8BPV5_9VIBR|nr:LysR family transcriptional regulator [Vibrio ostreicida]MDN3609182.1 LysR family transcriptional regulator [Vibrio ostreicida]NPD08075.1 LysR family transcriptional regulator [Vibrio ostreicida]